jgi:hypothetical protein
MTYRICEFRAFTRAISWRHFASKLGLLLLTTVFCTASIAKMLDMRGFQSTVRGSMLAPDYLVAPVSSAVIALEAGFLIGLWIPKTRPAALHLGAVLCSVFFGYSAWRALQGIPVPCHCFGRLFTMSPWQGMALNTGLLAILAWMITAEPTKLDRLATLERSAS